MRRRVVRAGSLVFRISSLAFLAQKTLQTLLTPLALHAASFTGSEQC